MPLVSTRFATCSVTLPNRFDTHHTRRRQQVTDEIETPMPPVPRCTVFPPMPTTQQSHPSDTHAQHLGDQMRRASRQQLAVPHGQLEVQHQHLRSEQNKTSVRETRVRHSRRTNLPRNDRQDAPRPMTATPTPESTTPSPPASPEGACAATRRCRGVRAPSAGRPRSSTAPTRSRPRTPRVSLPQRHPLPH